jgi:hypothetical protein
VNTWRDFAIKNPDTYRRTTLLAYQLLSLLRHAFCCDLAAALNILFRFGIRCMHFESPIRDRPVHLCPIMVRRRTTNQDRNLKHACPFRA